MERIEIDYRQLCDRSVRLSELNLKLNEEIGKIAEYTKNTDIFWDGDADEAFMAAVIHDITDMGLLLGRIDDSVKAMRKTVELYINNENEVQRMIGELLHERKNKV